MDAHGRLYVWLADRNGGYRNQISAFNDTSFDTSKVTGCMTAGDFDGDGKDEIAAFYDLGSASFNLYIFKATTATSTNVAFSKEVWYTANGTFYTSRIQNRITTGDFDGDGVDEIAAMYYYADLSMKVFVFNPVENNGTLSMSYTSWYTAAAGTFDSTKVTGRFVAGDFDGDGMDEIVAMYDTGNNSMVTYVFNKNGSGNSLTRETWLTAGEGSFGANFVTGTLVAGNFLGDDKDDLAMIYKYPSCAKVLTYESLGNHFGNWAQRHDGNGNYTFSGMQYQVFGGNLDGTGYDEMIAMYRQAERALSIYEFKNTGADKFELNTSLWNSQMIVRTESTATSTRIASETIGSDTYAYTYDVLGNITEIKKNGQTFRRYTYDDLGELIREDNASSDTTFIYTYDNGGNITSRIGYNYTAPNATPHLRKNKLQNIDSFGYSNGEWKDLLSHADSLYYNYDAIGNPTRWAGCDTTWSDGRLLMDIDGEISFEYNSSGIRTKKECDGITHEYLLDGTTILCEKRSDGITLDFYYDESGNIFAMGYDGAMYYHVRNVLGEIIGLIDSNGAYVAKYTYDAWGWPETIEDGSGNDVQFNNSHIANINPFRYKGYYFDNEYYLYYLQSRYYDPMACRFINADGLIQSSGSVLGLNMFAYCNNSPIAMKDTSGTRPIICGPDEKETDEERKLSFEFMKEYTTKKIAIDKQNALKKEFNELYYNTYGKSYDFSEVSEIRKTQRHVSYFESVFDNAMIGVIGTAVSYFLAKYGINTGFATGVGIVGGAIVSPAVPSPGDYCQYQITSVTYETVYVRSFGPRGQINWTAERCKKATTVTYRVVNGELENDGATYADETLYYRYLNHP